MKRYLDLVGHILERGEKRATRTGIDAVTVSGMLFEHEMAQGFPLLTTKKVPFRLVATELEFFLRGITDKKWLQEKNNHIWDEWANPTRAPYGHDEASKKRMSEERDLGPVYGFQWRHFGAAYENFDTNYDGEGVDQLRGVVQTLKTDPNDRRMLVSAWNPVSLHTMGLPPCHYAFQVTVVNGKLNLMWNQRSVDVMLGLPFNIASYGLLLHLLAKESGFREGRLVGFLGDTHVYVNHLEGAKEQLEREPYPLPHIATERFSSIFDWTAEDTTVENYQSHPRIAFEIAV